jgi:hypothetical protein
MGVAVGGAQPCLCSIVYVGKKEGEEKKKRRREKRKRKRKRKNGKIF